MDRYKGQDIIGRNGLTIHGVEKYFKLINLSRGFLHVVVCLQEFPILSLQ